MLTIERLRLHLPEGFEHRSHRIARLLADELAIIPLESDGRLERLSVSVVPVYPGCSDHQVARSIAKAIQAKFRKNV